MTGYRGQYTRDDREGQGTRDDRVKRDRALETIGQGEIVP